MIGAVERKILNEHITICDPAVGSGAMRLAACEVRREQEIDPYTEAFVTGVDITLLCAEMTYIQLSAAGISRGGALRQ